MADRVLDGADLQPWWCDRTQALEVYLCGADVWLSRRGAFGNRRKCHGATVHTNVHGGFVIGAGTLGIYTAVVGIEDLSAEKGLKRALRLALITLAATLVTLATPWGISLWQEVIHPVFSPTIRTLI